MKSELMHTRMRERLSAASPRIAVTVAVVAPYWHLLGLHALLVTQDELYSDVWDGELPPRALFGRLLREGHWPGWHGGLCGGGSYATASIDPLSLPTFGLLPVVPALDVFLLAVLLLIAHSTYSLARALSASRAGAALSAIAFAHSGYVVCQLKHLSVMATVAWIPLALLCLERALAPRAERSFEASGDASAVDAVDRSNHLRLWWLLAFAAVFGAQTLAGFPQSAYISALCYAAWTLFRGVGLWRRDGARRAAWLWLATALAVAVGAAVGAVVLLPMRAAAATSDRATGIAFEWASAQRYDVRNAIDFFVPYANGDISDLSYKGPGTFWEDYAYLGLATVPLALFGVVRARRRAFALMLLGIVVVAYSMVLGPTTPLFKLAFLHLPGMGSFRFPTRFLVLVELGLALLAGLGLSELQRWIASRSLAWSSRAPWIATFAVVLTFLDLLHAQPRQNAIVEAARWLEPPRTAAFLQAQPGQFRIWSPLHRAIHFAAFDAARGWSDLTPYYQMRDVISPNSNLYWGLDNADCYSGLTSSAHVDTWGDHNRPGILLDDAMRRAGPALETSPAMGRILRIFNVRYVLSPWKIDDSSMRVVDASTPVRVYEVSNVQPRIYLVAHAYGARTNAEAADRLLHKRFDSARDVILHDAPESLTPKGVPTSAPPGTLAVTRYDGDQIVVESTTTAPSFLVSSDAYAPSWHATIDGVEARIFRANMTGRAIELPAGRHTVVFRHRDDALRRGALVTAGASGLLALMGFVLMAFGRARRAPLPARPTP
jgi:hypothetical protein